jgi:hypothetical protein
LRILQRADMPLNQRGVKRLEHPAGKIRRPHRVLLSRQSGEIVPLNEMGPDAIERQMARQEANAVRRGYTYGGVLGRCCRTPQPPSGSFQGLGG